MYVCKHKVLLYIYIYTVCQMQKMKEDALRKVKPLVWLRMCKNPVQLSGSSSLV